MKDSSSLKAPQFLRRFSPYYKPYIGVLIFDLFCATLTTVSDLALPMIVRKITNAAIYDMASLTIKTILTLGGFYLILRIIVAFANYYMANVGHVMGTRMETDMRRDLFEHLQRMPFSFYDETKIGQIMARITSDLFEITEFAHHCPEEFFIAGLKIIVSFIILSNINIPLTLLVFSSIPLMILITKRVRKHMQATFREQRHQVGEINAQVEDSLLGVRVVKSFANEEVENNKFKSGNQKFLNIKKRSYKYMGAFHGVVEALDGLMYIVVVVIGALFLIKGKINVGDYTAYLLYVATLLASVKTIVTFAEQFQKGMTGFERFAELMDTEITIKDSQEALELKNVQGNISFNNVSFNYGDNNEDVLHDISINIKQGENIALVGPSGAGKTTLCNLIPRFYDVTDGSVTLDGTDVRKISLKSLRDNIGVVQQDVYLFSGTVFDNISYGKLDATREEVIAASALAGADEFINELPNGYDSFVGERGVKLSGGQKQRISIARVFLKNPPVLIMDEATSSLDNESEAIVQKSLEKLAKGRTTLTIAHRLTTIRNADKILVLTENGIEEQGTHEELIQHGKIYKNLYQLYNK